MRRDNLENYKRMGRWVHAAMYLRKSRSEESMSREETLERHREALTAFAEKAGYLIDDVYEEVVSGESLFARPEMMKLMEAVSAGRYEAVLCMDMQRLGRGGMYDQGFILDTFKLSETLIVTPDRVYDLTADFDEQAAEMETFMSRGEYRLITKRLQRGLRQTISHGAFITPAPYGYKNVRVDRLPTLEIIPEEAECVRLIYKLYEEGNGCTRIMDAVNALGYRPRRVEKFSRNSVRYILRCPTYAGLVRWDYSVHVKSGVGPDRVDRRVTQSPDKWTIEKGAHPAIIPLEQWQRVQDLMEARGTHPVDRAKVANPLGGLVRCGRCGSYMQMQPAKGKPALTCRTRGCCASAQVAYVEEAVLAQLEQLTKDLEIRLATEAPPDTSALEDLYAKTQTQLKKIKERRDRLYSLLEDGTYTRVVFTERMQLLFEEEQQLNTSAADLSQQIEKLRSRNLAQQVQQLHTVLDLYGGSSPADKRQLLHSVIQRIDYFKAKKTKPADFSITITLRDTF